MANPARTQAEFDRFFDRWLQPSRKVRVLQQLLDLFEGQDQTSYVIEEDPQENTTVWDLDGIDPGVNTDASGNLYVRFVANVGDWDITVYKATGGGAGNAVCSATAVADGATATLTASNSSGITGTVILAAVVVADVTDTHILHVLTKFSLMDIKVFDGAEPEDGDLLREQSALNHTIANAIRSARDQALATIRSGTMFDFAARVIKSPKNIAFLNKAVEVDDDVVTNNVTGLLERLRDAMEDNATLQKVAVQTTAAGAVTADAGNDGLGTLAQGTVGDNMLPGLVTVICVNEEPDEEFEVSFKADDGSVDLVGRERLTVGKGWIDPDINVSLTLTRTFDKNATDATDVNLAAATGGTAPTVTGITRQNSDGGVLYIEVVANGANWNFEFYKASTKTAADLVAKATNIATDANFTATQQNRSGLQVAWKAGSAPVGGADVQLDANLFSTGTSTQGADQFSFNITRSVKGEIQDFVRRYLDGVGRNGWRLNEGATPTIADAVLLRNSTIFSA